MLAMLLCALVMLPLRLLRVFVGTYLSRNEDVRRAGLVADVNALALAVAVILLLTSRGTFQDAEDTIKHKAWANLLQDTPGAACASLNQQPFSGRITRSIHFNCSGDPHRAPHHPRWTHALDASNVKQVVGVLRALDECKAFSMGMQYMYKDRNVCYTFADSSGSVSSIIGAVASPEAALALVQNVTSWDRLDVITPKGMFECCRAGAACATCLQDSAIARAVNGTCYSPAAPFGSPGFPNALGFPRDMQIVRWLDRSGKGIFLGVKCSSSLDRPSPELLRCLSSSALLGAVRGPWTPDFRANAKPADPANFSLHGHEHGAFCPASSTLGMFLFRPSPVQYQCSNGAQSTQVRLLNDEMAALEGTRSFPYFRCVSYDELFGVYVGTVGVLMSVALATGALYVTDVLRPMLLAGREAWSWDVVQQVAGATGTEAEDCRAERAKTVFEVILRCIAGCALGSALGMCLIYAPWRAFLNQHGRTCNPA